ncbi:FxDxF family PEP-CTERM protein [Janthinobacterium sp.]|uniref:FxDxF family PEP-CTERM protein n=1 Tax=Janthinobacterium sp. TaxID=1871054 RepID=UPI00293D2D79|nr:FxDxF family PEP-CTERM protein [Janthinobacterium sp.]
MKKNTGTVLAALLFATAAMFAQSAQAVKDISATPSAIVLASNGSVNFGGTFSNGQKSNTFANHYTFSTTGISDLDLIVTSKSISAKTGLNMTGLGLYNAHGLVASGTMQLTGAEDKWVFSTKHLAAGSYFFQVSGNVVAATGGSFGANGHIMALPVPEPETYGMLLGGLALIGFVARRRKSAAPAA